MVWFTEEDAVPGACVPAAAASSVFPLPLPLTFPRERSAEFPRARASFSFFLSYSRASLGFADPKIDADLEEDPPSVRLVLSPAGGTGLLRFSRLRRGRPDDVLEEDEEAKGGDESEALSLPVVVPIPLPDAERSPESWAGPPSILQVFTRRDDAIKP